MSYPRILFLLLLGKAALSILFILYGGIGLGPDEAQYWSWSRNLDVGYYSKPPGVAWQIFLSTLFLGSTELGVRLSAVVIGSLASWALFNLGKALGMEERKSFLASLIFTLSPLGLFSTFFTITDGGMLLFWIAALIPFMKSVKAGDDSGFIKMGLFIALGALFKWPIYILWTLPLFFSVPLSKRVFYGVFVSLLGLLPTAIWNFSHEWATFRHVFSTVQGGHGVNVGGNFFEFLGAQMLLFFPVFFVFFICGIFVKKRDLVGKLALHSFLLLCCFAIYALFTKAQGNWCLFVYPAASLLVAEHYSESKAVKRSLVFSPLCVSLLVGLCLSPLLPWKMNPFKHNLGWHEMGKALAKENEKFFLFSDKYQTSSLLYFYGPVQQRSYFFNLSGARKNQFSFWPFPEQGKDGLFVWVENGPSLDEKVAKATEFYVKALQPYFASISTPERMPLYSNQGEVVKEALFFYCFNYRGVAPMDPEKF